MSFLLSKLTTVLFFLLCTFPGFSLQRIFRRKDRDEGSGSYFPSGTGGAAASSTSSAAAAAGDDGRNLYVSFKTSGAASPDEHRKAAASKVRSATHSSP